MLCNDVHIEQDVSCASYKHQDSAHPADRQVTAEHEYVDVRIMLCGLHKAQVLTFPRQDVVLLQLCTTPTHPFSSRIGSVCIPD